MIRHKFDPFVRILTDLLREHGSLSRSVILDLMEERGLSRVEAVSVMSYGIAVGAFDLDEGRDALRLPARRANSG